MDDERWWESEFFKLRFPKGLDEDGRLTLGVRATHRYCNGEIHLEQGLPEAYVEPVTVRGESDAQAFINVMRVVSYAIRWNTKKESSGVIGEEEFRKRLKALREWAARSYEDQGNFSHLGIHLDGTCVFSNRYVKVSFTVKSNGKGLFKMYPEMSPAHLLHWWDGIEYDPGLIFSVVAEEMGGFAVDQWNDGMSAVFNMEISKNVYKSFCWDHTGKRSNIDPPGRMETLSIDRFLYFKDTKPTKEEIEKEITDYFSGMTKPRRDSDRWIIFLDSRLKEHDSPGCQRDRWIEVWLTTRNIDVLTRRQDELTNVLADGLAKRFIRRWGLDHQLGELS